VNPGTVAGTETDRKHGLNPAIPALAGTLGRTLGDLTGQDRPVADVRRYATAAVHLWFGPVLPSDPASGAHGSIVERESGQVIRPGVLPEPR